jgi:hypothetical protein
MKRKATAWLVTLTCLAALSVNARAADLFLLGYAGFDYEDPNPIGGPLATGYLALGEGYRMVGFITSVNPYYLILDFTNNENTVVVGNPGELLVDTRNFIDPFIQVTCTTGHVRYYEDPSSGGASHALYGTNPPNATAPSSFSDGNEVLGGTMTSFSLTYDTDASDGFTDGSWTAMVNLDEGSQLNYVPPQQRSGWTMTGQLGYPNAVPQGYANQTSGECRIPDTTPTTVKSWGNIKNLYR